jgi:hypothetical protein
MENNNKVCIAIQKIKPEAQFSFNVDIITEEDFNKIEWKTGVDNEGASILTTVNPHSELTWIKVNAEMDRLQAGYDAQDYARKRKAEYPTIEELVVALYDSEDRAAIDAKRAEIKLKYKKG